MIRKDNDKSESLNKYISGTGICSRREADEMIKKGRVKINGVLAVGGNRVLPGDKVTLDGKNLKHKPKTVYIAFNKPIGIVCTTDSRERDNIIDYIGHKERLFPIGRLDKDSEGLIFLTNDGEIVNKILRAGNQHDKEYIVKVNAPMNHSFIKQMAAGVPILDTVTKKCKVKKLNKVTFKIVLVQGLNRQIRRMCEYLGYEVTELKRVRIMNVKLGKLPVGKWRRLQRKEVSELQRMVKDSSNLSQEEIHIEDFSQEEYLQEKKTNQSEGRSTKSGKKKDRKKEGPTVSNKPKQKYQGKNHKDKKDRKKSGSQKDNEKKIGGKKGKAKVTSRKIKKNFR